MLTDSEVKYIQRIHSEPLVFVDKNVEYDCKLLKIHLRDGLYEMLQIFVDVEMNGKIRMYCAFNIEVKFKNKQLCLMT